MGANKENLFHKILTIHIVTGCILILILTGVLGIIQYHHLNTQKVEGSRLIARHIAIAGVDPIVQTIAYDRIPKVVNELFYASPHIEFIVIYDLTGTVLASEPYPETQSPTIDEMKTYFKMVSNDAASPVLINDDQEMIAGLLSNKEVIGIIRIGLSNHYISFQILTNILFLSGLGLILLSLSILIYFIFLNRKLGVPLTVVTNLMQRYQKNSDIDIVEQIDRALENQPNNEIGLMMQTFKNLICAINDRTIQQKKAEKEKLLALKRAAEHEKYALVGRIAGKMAHDFNNILGVIMGNTEIALINCKDSFITKKLQLILNQTRHGSNLTKNLVAFAKDQEPRQVYFPINDKIDLVLNLLEKEIQHIEVERELMRNLPDLLADSGMIENCLVNLIQNAIHAMGKSKHGKLILRTYQNDDAIHVEIEDNGCGIPKAYLSDVFEPSFTLKGSRDITGSYAPGIKGTGYGMANVKRYVEQHLGTIFIESDEGKGTKITLNFPEIKKELAQQEIMEIKATHHHSGKTILLVEDEPAISEVQYQILTHDPCHHQVDPAKNGEDAINLFNKNKYDFVSLDYILPGEVNGMDVYHHIRQKNIKIPILFISGNLEFLESIRELKRQDPYIDHVSKPCTNRDYIDRINRLLSHTSASNSLFVP